MNIRGERPQDHAAIAQVLLEAFAEMHEEDGEDPNLESKIVESIHGSEAYVPQLSLVAESGSEVVGYLMFSRAELHGRETTSILALGPMAVSPPHQRRGIGAALIEEGHARADQMDSPLVAVVGHRDYYPRFGFVPARIHGIYPQWPELPDEVWMFRPLSSYTADLRGTVKYPAAFDQA